MKWWMWLIAWMVLSVPLSALIGKFLKFGLGDDE